jgi:hypothetical protein
MALEYDLHLVANINPRRALDLLAEQVGELVWSEGDSCLFHEVATITVGASRVVEGRPSAVEEAFGFSPNVRVGFRFRYDVDYDKDYARFKRLMLQVTTLLLEQAQDAVLLFNGETIVLQRFGGKLVLNADYHVWDDDDWLKSGGPVPFERRPLPSPLL